MPRSEKHQEKMFRRMRSELKSVNLNSRLIVWTDAQVGPWSESKVRENED